MMLTDSLADKKIQLRKAVVGDAQALGRIHVDAWCKAYQGVVPENFLQKMNYNSSCDIFTRMLAMDDGETFILEVDGVPAGFMSIGPCRDSDAESGVTGEIQGIYLAPDFWRQGLGRFMCEHGLQMLKHNGYLDATLWVFAANTAARKFYASIGFLPDGTAKNIRLAASDIQAIRCCRKL